MKRDGRFIKANGHFIKAVHSNNGRFIKAAMAVLSTGSGQMARSLDLGCGWPISYCPVQAVYQRPSLAIFSKGWESKLPFYQGRPAAMAMVSRVMAVLSPAAMGFVHHERGRGVEKQLEDGVFGREAESVQKVRWIHVRLLQYG